MAIRLNCPTCNALLSVDEQHRGKQIRCGKCQQVTVAREPELPTPPIVAAAPAPAVQTPPALAIQVEKKSKSPPLPMKGPPKPKKSRDDEPRRPQRQSASATSSLLIMVILLLAFGVVGVMLVGCVVSVGWWAIAPRPAPHNNGPI